MIGSIDDDDDENEELELGQNVISQSNAPNDALTVKENESPNNTESKNDQNENSQNDGNSESKTDDFKSSKSKTVTTTQRVVTREGLRPYIQIFKNAKLIFSSRRKGTKLKFYDKDEGHIKFEVNKQIEGDVLVRIRHLCQDGVAKVCKVRGAMMS